MRGKSHRFLGRYLAETYMSGTRRPRVDAFLFGCIEPDWNPVTYLKGSIRSQWLRGHNYGNARRYMQRISRRLENRAHLNLWDYYTLGKLIHYTTDAFTYAHNPEFTSSLGDHREYEAALQNHFLPYLESSPQVKTQDACSIMDAIRSCHREYIRQDIDIRNDSKYALQACCCVLGLLLTPCLIP